MANKIKFGSRPKFFKEIEVSITLPEGDVGIIPVTFKYMDKEEFGAWQDEMIAKAKAKNATEQKDAISDAAEAKYFSFKEIYKDVSDTSADRLLEIISSWGLDVPLTKEALIELEKYCGASSYPALFDAFGKACREGRLGN